VIHKLGGAFLGDFLSSPWYHKVFSVCIFGISAVLVCRPLAAQSMVDNVVALFEFESVDEIVSVSEERHYRLVAPEDLSTEGLARYRHTSPK
jgi:hypothetical protein